MLNSIIQSQTNQAKTAVSANVRKVAAKTRAKYALVFILLLSVVPALFYLHHFNIDIIPTYLFWAMQVYALLLGIIHLWQMGHRFGWRNQYSFTQKLILSLIILSGTMLIQCIIVWFCQPVQNLFLLFPTSSLPFLFPLFAFSAYDYSVAVPSPVYKTWKYNSNIKLPDMDSIDFNNSYVLTFKLKKNTNDFEYTLIKFKSPLDRLTFGDLFYLYVDEYNEKHREYPIQYLNQLNQPHEWVFYLNPSKWWQSKRYIDPSLTIRENKLGENYVIVSERTN